MTNLEELKNLKIDKFRSRILQAANGDRYVIVVIKLKNDAVKSEMEQENKPDADGILSIRVSDGIGTGGYWS